MKQTTYSWTLGIALTFMSLSSCNERPQVLRPTLSAISDSADAGTPEDKTEEEPLEEPAKDMDTPKDTSTETPAEETTEPLPTPEPAPLALYTKLKPKIFDADCKSCHKGDVK